MTARSAGKGVKTFELGVAPVEMIRDDFRALDSRVTLRTNYDVEQLVLMQTVEGHAHAGHGLFYGKRYPNTTLDDVSKALRLSPADVKAERQALIDEVQCAVESHMFYITGAPYAVQELDHGQCTNVEFYEYIEERLKAYQS